MTADDRDLEKKYFEAVEECNITEVEKLLSSGEINVDLKNSEFYDRTALHVAACFGHSELAQLLLDVYSATVNVPDARGDIPLQVATDYRNIDIVKLLLERGSDLREYAAEYLNVDQVEELFRAAEDNNIGEVTRLLDEYNLDVNTEDRSNWNRTLLEVAAANGHYDLVRVLVDDYHADVLHNDDLEESALVKAVNNNHDNVANFLLENGSANVLSESSDESEISLNLFIN